MPGLSRNCRRLEWTEKGLDTTRWGQKGKGPGHAGPPGLLAFMEVKWESIGIFWAEVWHDLTVSFYRITLATALRTDWNGQGRKKELMVTHQESGGEGLEFVESGGAWGQFARKSVNISFKAPHLDQNGPWQCVHMVGGHNKICTTGIFQPQMVQTTVFFPPPTSAQSLQVWWCWSGCGYLGEGLIRNTFIYWDTGMWLAVSSVKSYITATCMAPKNIPAALCTNSPDKVGCTETWIFLHCQMPHWCQRWKRNKVWNVQPQKLISENSCLDYHTCIVLVKIAFSPPRNEIDHTAYSIINVP